MLGVQYAELQVISNINTFATEYLYYNSIWIFLNNNYNYELLQNERCNSTGPDFCITLLPQMMTGIYTGWGYS